MKKILVLLFTISKLTYAIAQEEGIKEIKKEEADEIENKVNKGIDFGVSLGFNTVFDDIYEARVSPLDNRLKITTLPKSAFLISTGLSVPLTKGKLGGRYYRKLDNEGKKVGPVYFVPYGFCFIATINLVSFNSASSGSLFNQKIDGGLGIGYRVNDNFQFSLTYEMISYRQPRQFLLDIYNDKELRDVDGKLISSINADNNDYFTDKYMPSISFKFFYLIAYKPVK
jgi:hypothetical protein